MGYTAQRLAARNAARRRYVVKHRELGLCVKCSEKATHGYFCRKHWEAYKILGVRYSIKLQQKRRAQGLCIRCGMPLEEGVDAKTKCVSCLDYARPSPNPVRRYR